MTSIPVVLSGGDFGGQTVDWPTVDGVPEKAFSITDEHGGVWTYDITVSKGTTTAQLSRFDEAAE